MPYIKQIERSAIGAFCPHAPFLAAGTVAGAIDISFSTSSVLEVFPLDFASGSEALVPCGSIAAPERFNRLAWGQHLADPSFPQLGLLAGGLADGSVCLWDPSILLDPSAKEQHRVPLLAKMQKHTGAVKGLEFNSFSPNLLASGAADSDLCIWDVAKPATPSLYPALKGGAGAPGQAVGGEITYLAWNKKVQHILASCSTNGTTVVWDLKRQKPVISFRDPNSQRRASAIQWNPDIATQLIVASDDDRSPTLQMWDLRNSVSPLKEFVGHHKGVLSMAWSPHDSSLLLSSGKDNRTICWDVHSGDIVCEFSAANWNFDVQWSPTIPGIFATSSFDGKLGVCNLANCTGSKVTETVNADFTVTHSVVGDATPLAKAPAWMKRPVGATFGFGGRLVSFTTNRTQHTDPATGAIRVQDSAVLSVKQVVTETELVTRSEGFEAAIQGGNLQTLREYCNNKRAALAVEGAPETPESKQEAETWSFLSVLFEGDDARRVLLQTLGFKDLPAREGSVQPGENGVDAAAAGVEGLSLQGADGVPRLEVPGASAGGAPPQPSPNQLLGQDDPDFFDKLEDSDVLLGAPAPAAQAPEPDLGAVQPLNAGAMDAMAKEAGKAGADGHSHAPGHVPGGEMESEIVKALTVGCYATAVEHCLTVHRYADALLIANTAGRDLYQRTMHKYMQKCPHPYQAIIRANLEGDYSALIRTRPVGQWRETLAMLVTYTDRDKFRGLADTLASRLAQASMHHEASLCWVCGGHTDQAVSYWARNCTGASSMTVEVLQNVIEKAVVMGMAPGVSSTSSSPDGVNKASQSLSELVTAYASLLASNGRMATALDYLEHVPGEASTTVAVLKDRIYRSGVAELPPGVHPPPFPFVRDELVPTADEKANAAAANAYGQYGQGYGQAAAATNAYGQYGQQQAQQTQQQQAYNAAQQQYTKTQQPYNATAGYGQAQAGQYGQQQAQTYNTAPQAATAPSPYAQQQAANPYAQAQQAQQQQQQANAYSQYNQYQAQQQNAYQPAAQQQQNAYQPVAQQQQSAYQPSAPQQNAYQAPRPAAPTAPAPAPFTPTSVAAPVVPQQQQVQAPPAPPPAPVQQNAYAPAVNPTSFVPQSVAPPPAPSHAAPAAPQPNFFMPTAPVAAPVAQMPSTGSGSFGGAPPPPAPPPGSMMAAPTSQKAMAPPPPPGPPANISVTTADTSNVAPELRPVIASLTNLYNTCMPLANNPAKKREMDDNTKKIGQLFWRLNTGEVSASVVPKLQQLCAAIDQGDWQTANHIQVQMTTTDWDECGFWLGAVKRMIKLRQTS
ncbi:hypothetical protein HYH03_003181 [Edaphochlamys debaryana]|uniref:Uncharacterized protein n=1 Tax=Edaphochlamys debaryana TaxID=47281 RepID=A0A835YHZ4_9CHLO|nr:hypothetical protein HYH03_003181 [Edaphochlamys debaryana]|eukprot:KAG2498995.1 hypothetical protein HYH03_003181 [Edaphochlamys debaryana]